MGAFDALSRNQDDSGRTTRRQLLLAAGTGITASLAGCSSALKTDDPLTDRVDERVDGQWVMHNATPENTRLSSAVGPDADPAVEWRQTVSGTLRDPIVLNSLVYSRLPDETSPTAIEVATGEVIGGLDAHGNEAVVVGASNDGLYVLYQAEGWAVGCQNPQTGTEAWTTDLPGPANPRATLSSESLYLTGIQNGWVRSIDRTDGSEQWTFETTHRTPTVAVGNDLVTFVFENYVFGLDTESGDRLWHRQLDQSTATRPILVDNTLFVGTEDGNLLLLDETGNTVDQIDIADDAISSLLAVDGQILVGTADEIVTIEPTAQQPVTKIGYSSTISEFSVGPERIYAADYDLPGVVAFDRDSLDVVWSVPLSDRVIFGPVILDGTILVRIGPLGPDADHDQRPELVALR